MNAQRGCQAAISLSEYRTRRARAGRPAPAMRFAHQLARRPTLDEITESVQARRRAAERLAYRSPVRPAFVWGGALLLGLALLFSLFNH